MPYRYFIELAYDGSGFRGWQVQPNAVTVQSLMEKGLALACGIKSSITGCGRTDTGVNAKVFYAHFDVDLPLEDPDKITFRLNRFLPPTIAVKRIFPVAAGAHARFGAIWREYHYTLLTQKDPFMIPYALLVPGKLDIDRMNEGAATLTEYSDFQCFSKVKTQVSNFRCSIEFARWIQNGHIVEFQIRADRFLRNMVRAIVGTMLDLGKHRMSLQEFRQVLMSGDRRKAGVSVPAKGLILYDIAYPDSIYSGSADFFSKERTHEIISHDHTHTEFHDRSSNEPYE